MGTERKKLVANPRKRLDIAFQFNDSQIVASTVTGTYTSLKKLPIGAIVRSVKSVTPDGFAGDTTCSLQVGWAANLNKFNGATETGFAATKTSYTQPAAEADSGPLSADTAVVITLTGAAAYASITQGHLYVQIMYEDTNAKAI
jgi:hypothetical protein